MRISTGHAYSSRGNPCLPRPLVTPLLYMDIRSLWWSTINSFEGGQLEIRVTGRSGEFWGASLLLGVSAVSACLALRAPKSPHYYRLSVMSRNKWKENRARRKWKREKKTEREENEKERKGESPSLFAFSQFRFVRSHYLRAWNKRVSDLWKAKRKDWTLTATGRYSSFKGVLEGIVDWTQFTFFFPSSYYFVVVCKCALYWIINVSLVC